MKNNLPRPLSKEVIQTWLNTYGWILAGCILLLGIGHILGSGWETGGMRWFHLDRERNLPTWFTGFILLQFGALVFITGLVEYALNQKYKQRLFPAPWLWFLVAAVALGMSLDEITILHENLFWREIRLFSADNNRSMAFMTQWQVIFAPPILLIFSLLTFLFYHRFKINAIVRRLAITALTCWVLAITLEGTRSIFKYVFKDLYTWEVLLEELLELGGALALLLAVTHYLNFLTGSFNERYHQQLLQYPKMFTPRSLQWVVIAIGTLLLSAALAYGVAKHVASKSIELPALHQRALNKSP